MDKTALRQMMLEKRLSYNAVEKDEADNIICNMIYTDFNMFNNYYLYNCIKGEVNLSRLIKQLVKDDKFIYLPAIPEEEMVFRRYECDDKLVKGKYNIPEPTGEFCNSNSGLIIIPAIAYGTNFFRLGYGKGYYDRYLSKYTGLIKLGICYDFQLMDNLPNNYFDIPVDFVLTEKQIIRREKR